MVNRIDFRGHSSKVKVTVGIIDKCGVRGDATLCVVIFIFFILMSYLFMPGFQGTMLSYCYFWNPEQLRGNYVLPRVTLYESIVPDTSDIHRFSASRDIDLFPPIAMLRQFTVAALWLTSQLAKGRNSDKQKVKVPDARLYRFIVPARLTNRFSRNNHMMFLFMLFLLTKALCRFNLVRNVSIRLAKGSRKEEWVICFNL